MRSLWKPIKFMGFNRHPRLNTIAWSTLMHDRFALYNGHRLVSIRVRGAHIFSRLSGVVQSIDNKRSIRKKFKELNRKKGRPLKKRK